MIQVIKRPLITEKAMKLSQSSEFSQLRQYVFEVDPNANKLQIKSAVEALFEVNVVSVRTVRTKGKVKRRFTKTGLQVGKTALKKKAYVTLKAGQEIELVSGPQE